MSFSRVMSEADIDAIGGIQPLPAPELLRLWREHAGNIPRNLHRGSLMSLQMLVVSGPDEKKVFTIQAGPDLMLGRGQQCLYRLNDPRASRAHCQILLEGEQAIVIDNGGSGGTLVNGVAGETAVLKLGDVVQIGDTRAAAAARRFPAGRRPGGRGAGATRCQSGRPQDTDKLVAAEWTAPRAL